MSVTPSEVRRIAHLARLKVSGEELDRLTDDLNRILEHVEALGSLGSSGPEGGEVTRGELSSAHQGSELPADALFEGPDAFAPDWRDSFFVVPPPPGVQPGEDK